MSAMKKELKCKGMTSTIKCKNSMRRLKLKAMS